MQTMPPHVYLDHAATTPVSESVLAAMMPYFCDYYGNPSAIHTLGAASRDAVENARESVASALNARPEEIVFTSGGTEADNTAIRGAAFAGAGRHLLCSAVEHHAVLETMEALATRCGYALDVVPVDRDGLVDPDEVARRIRPDTALVSIMHANNEVGSVQPIGEIGTICRARGVLFHTDAVQTFGKLPIDVRSMGIDLLSVSGHKLYGPKGVGALYVRRGVKLERYQDGGEQERGRRAGTLNVPGIVGLGRAAEDAVAEMPAEAERLRRLRDTLIADVESRIDGARLSGPRACRLPGNAHFCIEGVQGESVLLALDGAGIYASAGSACSAGSVEPSHVLAAMGVARDLARGAIRLTMGRATTEDVVATVVQALSAAVRDIRRLA
ncbi:MAG TPA: cysteine desulfurase family protein [Chthonomonadaceae bacterium]|nr:cysteine desulfurase family protein [Chthonomonadaceae bacterium]